MNIPKELIKKYFRGECTEEERAKIQKWYNSLDQEADPIASLSHDEREQLKERMLQRVFKNIGYDDPEGESEVKRKGVLPIVYILSGAAATFLVLLAYTFITSRSRSPELVSGINEKITIQNLTSTIHKTVLSDSSVVWLSPSSKLEYPRHFRGPCRQIELEGEAFFDVTRDPGHPFVIKSGDIITKVLGTSFRIRAFKENNSAEVSVVTGKVTVMLENKPEEVVLLPSNKVTYLKDAHLLKRGSEQSAEMKIWDKASLSFENQPVSKVVDKLNTTFGIKISAADETINSLLLNADFTDQNLPDILEMLERSLNISYQIENNTIFLNKRK